MKINKKMFGILLLIPSAILLFLELKPIDLYEDPALIEAAKEDMLETLDGETYTCPIPDGCKPRAIGMTKA